MGAIFEVLEAEEIMGDTAVAATEAVTESTAIDAAADATSVNTASGVQHSNLYDDIAVRMMIKE